MSENAKVLRRSRGRPQIRPDSETLHLIFEAARAEFVRQALLYSHEQQESLRAHLLEACYALTESLGETVFDPAQAGGLGDLLEERLLAASNRQDLLAAFQDGLDRIAMAGDRPFEGKRLASMEEVKRYVDRHFTGP